MIGETTSQPLQNAGAVLHFARPSPQYAPTPPRYPAASVRPADPRQGCAPPSGPVTRLRQALLQNLLEEIDVRLVDHIVVSRTETVSMAARRLI